LYDGLVVLLTCGHYLPISLATTLLATMACAAIKSGTASTTTNIVGLPGCVMTSH
jgi:hypothetical protein